MSSILEQLRDLENPTPGSFDPEDEAGSLTAAKLEKHQKSKEYEHFEGESGAGPNQFGTLRKRANDSLAYDRKYKGIKVSRSELHDEEDVDDNDIELFQKAFAASRESHNVDDDDDDIDGVDEDYDDFKDDDFQFEDGLDNDDDNNYDDADDNNYNDVSSNEGSHESKQRKVYNDKSEESGKLLDENAEEFDSEGVYEDSADEVDNATENNLLKAAENEALKGKAVCNQLAIWDKLLEIRIKLQRCVQLANRYPQCDAIKKFEKGGGGDISKDQKGARGVLVSAINELLSIQSSLFDSNKHIDLMSSGGAVDNPDMSDEEIPSDSEPEMDNGIHDKETAASPRKIATVLGKHKSKRTIAEYEEEISRIHDMFHDGMEQTISKWDEKTRMGFGKTKSKSFSSFDRSVIKQIKQIVSDKERLIRRTQLKRTIYRTLGKKFNEQPNEEKEGVDLHLKNTDPEIFDDDDFYHQMLKEFIERKSNILTSDDPVSMGRQWLQIQKLRNKVKKKVDAKASKGRRIRYNVHSKLVNFMAPVNAGSMNDQSRNDLFRSLFGVTMTNEH